MGDATGEVECNGLRHRIDYAANTVRISVPRRCLDRPRWVRVGAKTISLGVDRRGEVIRYDDALATGTDGRATPSRITLGQRLQRG